MSNPKVKLAISLVTHNAEKYLPFCLNSLAGQSWQDFSLLVIDNGSTDGTVRYLKENFSQIKLVVHPHNIGFAKAHNQGIDWSDSDYLMLLNQDVTLKNDYLEQVIGYLERNPVVAALTGKILTWDFENNQKTEIIDSLGLKIFKNHRVADINQGQRDDGRFDEIKEIFGVSGTVPVYRRSALEKVKINFKESLRHGEYLDEDFFSYKEDVDLAYRLQLAGLTAVYFPGAVAYHDRSVKGVIRSTGKAIRASRRERDKTVKIYSYKNHLLLLLKNEFFINLVKYFFPIIFYELKKIIFILLFEQSTLRGLGLFLKQKSKIFKKRKYIIKNIKEVSAKELARWYV